MSLVKSKQRVTDHGEVFTPTWMVDAMLDRVKDEADRIGSRFLEPACGSGNFLVRILQRKMAAVEKEYGKSEFERRHFAILGLMSCYGIELLADNTVECRENMLAIIKEYLGADDAEGSAAARAVLAVNIVHADALTMLTPEGLPITFAEWSYRGKGKYQRRNFRYDVLTQMASYSQEGTLFADLGKHEIFTPIQTYPSMTLAEVATMFG